MEANTTNTKLADFVASVCSEVGLPTLKVVAREEFLRELRDGDQCILATSNGTIEPISRAGIEKLVNEPNDVQQ
jgi:hypothetical protein